MACIGSLNRLALVLANTSRIEAEEAPRVVFGALAEYILAPHDSSTPSP